MSAIQSNLASLARIAERVAGVNVVCSAPGDTRRFHGLKHSCLFGIAFCILAWKTNQFYHRNLRLSVAVVIW
jgi:hypothetical protein